MATARLRKTFRYPDLDSDDGQRGELDEQEQEILIQGLRCQDEKQNAQYKLIFTAIPLISSITYLPFLLVQSLSAPQRIFCFLGIGSLLSTAYSMWKFIPSYLDTKGDRRIRDNNRKDGLLKKYLGLSNALVSAFLFLAAYLLGDSSVSKEVLRILYVVPGVIYVIIFMVRRAMISVDIGELERLRYDFKELQCLGDGIQIFQGHVQVSRT
ncbi:uncharacterized protein CIMG_13781 [Coccidioides immitis RS]|uniref:Uncharacterized protein n=1 Tax=Coccidioides immitis (strain RS) TaxID=246410 RepID=A0A0D8JWF0_COCIM|nr:uncharacterized protein CIMG_13781 [Coccidioides immitis RS]KJF61627.1 hypothetical protein CIMG_13781 [Coccidioides immitis RS]